MVETMAGTADKAYAAFRSGMSRRGVDAALARPDIKADIAKTQMQRILNEALPAAVDHLVDVLTRPGARDSDRNTASKLVLHHAYGAAGGVADKAPHEMTLGELRAAEAAAKLQEAALLRELSNRAQPIIEGQAIEPPAPDDDIFA